MRVLIAIGCCFPIIATLILSSLSSPSFCSGSLSYIASNKSPWLAKAKVGDVYNVPISHGEGKFLADEKTVKALIEGGQIATQYVDLDGNATSDIRYNPNDSTFAIEGITSPDGRVFGKMGHSERIANGLYKNVYGDYDIKMFKSMVKYFK